MTVTPRTRKKDSGYSSKSSARRSGRRPTTGITGEIGIRRVDFVGLRAVSCLLFVVVCLSVEKKYTYIFLKYFFESHSH